MARRLLTLLLLLSLAGCAGQTKVDPIVIGADTISIVGEQAIATNQQYVTLCAAKALEAARCEAWRKFFIQFKKDYVAAASAYKAAAAAGQPDTAQAYAQQVQALSNQLVLYILVGRK